MTLIALSLHPNCLWLEYVDRGRYGGLPTGWLTLTKEEGGSICGVEIALLFSEQLVHK